MVEDKKSSRVNTLYENAHFFFSPLGLRGDARAAKPPAPSSLAPRLATLATAVDLLPLGLRGDASAA